MFFVAVSLLLEPSHADFLMCAGASEMESRLNAIWKMDHPMYRAYGNTMKTYDLAAKMAGCRGQSSYFVLRGLLSVPAELMARGPFSSTDDLLKEVTQQTHLAWHGL